MLYPTLPFTPPHPYPTLDASPPKRSQSVNKYGHQTAISNCGHFTKHCINIAPYPTLPQPLPHPTPNSPTPPKPTLTLPYPRVAEGREGYGRMGHSIAGKGKSTQKYSYIIYLVSNLPLPFTCLTFQIKKKKKNTVE